ncbi:MAG: hypothetical protein ACYDAC_08910 [Candidatus Dormibacteria bacterium]
MKTTESREGGKRRFPSGRRPGGQPLCRSRVSLPGWVGSAGIGAVLALLAGSGAASTATLVPGPPLPPQPGVEAPGCTPPPTAPGTWTLLENRPQAPSLLTVDPWVPCHILDATGPGTLRRSDDSARSWRTVLSDSARGTIAPDDPTCPPPLATVGGCVVSTPPFSIVGTSFASATTIDVAEGGNGDAFVTSGDGGGSWRLANQGIDGLPVAGLATAPGNPSVAYAAVIVEGNGAYQAAFTGGPNGALSNPPLAHIYRTTDGGGSWTATQMPSVADAWGHENTIVDMRVDPGNPQHLYLLRNDDTLTVLEETLDGGQTYSIKPVSAAASPTQLLVAGTPSGVRLYAVGFFNAAVGDTTAGLLGASVIVSTDDGATWHPTPAQPPSSMISGTLVATLLPTDPRRIVLADLSSTRSPTSAVVFASSDGLATLQQVADPPVDGRAGVTLTIGQDAPVGGCHSTNSGVCGPPDAALQADRLGNVYLALCYGNPQPNPTPCGSAGRVLERLTPPDPAPPPRSPVAPPPVSGNAQVATELTSCVVPNPNNAVAGEGGLAFDGDSLIYTQNNAYNPVGSPDPDGHLYYMNPATCAYGGEVDVTFSHADIAAVASSSGWYSGAQQPFIEDISYDARRNTLWGTIQPSPCCEGTDRLPLFTYTVTRAPTPATHGTAVARLRAIVGECPPGQYELAMMSYSYTDDSLWTCNASNRASHLRAADLATIPPSCFDPIVDPGGGGSTGYGDWAVVGPLMYIHSEDDSHVNVYTQADCQLLRSLVHRTFLEPNNEDEQMVCDPVTFSPRSGFALPQTAAMWIRDASAGLVTAYGLTDACPLPTALAASPPVVLSGGTPSPQVCATVSLVGPGSPIASLPLQFTVDGQHVADALSSVAGHACAPAPPALAVGRHSVVVSWAGGSDYLPSAATTAITVLPVVSLAALSPAARNAVAPEATPLRGSGLASLTQGPPQTGSEIEQAQAIQSQANSQTQLTVQPGMMVQRRQQEQVAAQRVGISNDIQAEQMLAVRHRGVPAVVVAAGQVGAGLLLGLALLVRQPMVRVARSRRRARQPERLTRGG